MHIITIPSTLVLRLIQIRSELNFILSSCWGLLFKGSGAGEGPRQELKKGLQERDQPKYFYTGTRGTLPGSVATKARQIGQFNHREIQECCTENTKKLKATSGFSSCWDLLFQGSGAGEGPRQELKKGLQERDQPKHFCTGTRANTTQQRCNKGQADRKI